MATKRKKSAPSASDSQFASAIKESASQIWLAGLGAFSKAQAEGGKVFEALAKEGGTIHKRTRKLTEDKVSEVTEKMGKVASDLSRQANGKWDKLEQVFEERVARALSSLGVPTKKELDSLKAKVESMDGKAAKAAPAKKAAVKKPAAKKVPAKKRAVAKKTVARKAAS